MSIYSTDRPAAAGDLSRLKIERDVPRRRRWLPFLILAVVALIAAAAYPSARDYYRQQRAPEVEIVRAIQVATAADGGLVPVPVLVATGYVVARRSSDVGVKTGGRLQFIGFEEGTRVRGGQVIARIEHADLDAQLAAARAAVAEAETLTAENMAAHDEDARQLERQRALAKDGITTMAALTGAEAASQVSAARVRSAEAAIVSARARIRVTEAAIENTNVRAPFDGIVIRKRAEVGETVSPFGVAGQAAREGGAIATIADLRELEVQTEVSESSVAKLARTMPAVVKLQAYPDTEFRARVREIFPSADRAKAIVEVRVTILDASPDVKPEMTASVTFLQSPARRSSTDAAPAAGSLPAVVIPRRAVVERDGKMTVWVVTAGVARVRTVTLGAARLDQVEIVGELVPGEAVILNAPSSLADQAPVRVKGAS